MTSEYRTTWPSYRQCLRVGLPSIQSCKPNWSALLGESPWPLWMPLATRKCLLCSTLLLRRSSQRPQELEHDSRSFSLFNISRFLFQVPDSAREQASGSQGVAARPRQRASSVGAPIHAVTQLGAHGKQLRQFNIYDINSVLSTSFLTCFGWLWLVYCRSYTNHSPPHSHPPKFLPFYILYID